MSRKRLIFVFLLILLGVVIYVFKKTYNILYSPITYKEQYLFIPTGSTLSDVANALQKEGILNDTKEFERIARWKNYNKHIHPGKYHITKNMNGNEIINLLRSGTQVPVDLKLENFRTKEQLISKVSSLLEVNPDEMRKLLNDEDFLSKYNMTKETALLLFMPNTYQLYWNTSAKQFIEKMSRYYKNFWNESRIEKAQKMNMSLAEVSILASIVQLETTKPEEMSTIAGVYFNRLKKGIPLQADPTVIFALGDFNIHRLYFNQLKIDSPYNTYKYKGLPPGPICMPNPITIDRVLNHEDHNYLYFCAKEDLSGYHYFARTSQEHFAYAVKYRKTLNKLTTKQSVLMNESE